MTRRARLIGPLACAVASAAPAVKAPVASLPPYAGGYQPQGVDERGLWMEADEDERALRDSPALVADPALNAYVRRVLCDTVGAERCAAVRLYLVRLPVFNASMDANGAMRVYTGLLLRVRSEAELAAVLAHEFAHFENRHTLAGFRRARGATDLAMWTGMLGAFNVTYAAGAVQTSLIGGVYAFNRDQERAADVGGFHYLATSRYRPGAFAAVWRREMDEADATAAGRCQRSTRYDRTPFFATHPTEAERASYLAALAAKTGDEGDEGEAPFRAAMAQWRPLFLADQLKLNDFGGSEYLLGQLAGGDWTPDLLFARGELYRMRGHPRDLVAAADFYRQAIAKGDADPLAHRGLGLALLRSGQAADGRAALADYLKRAPHCADAAMLQSLIDQQ